MNDVIFCSNRSHWFITNAYYNYRLRCSAYNMLCPSRVSGKINRGVRTRAACARRQFDRLSVQLSGFQGLSNAMTHSASDEINRYLVRSMMVVISTYSAVIHVAASVCLNVPSFTFAVHVTNETLQHISFSYLLSQDAGSAVNLNLLSPRSHSIKMFVILSGHGLRELPT